jgi:hypothetical protein
MMPPYDYVANAVRMLYKDRELFATGVDFDEDGVEQNQAKEGEIFPVRWFLVLSTKVDSTYRFFGYFDNY